MNEPQTKAFNQISELMREHFSAGVICVQVDEDNENHLSEMEHTFHGGIATALGLTSVMYELLLSELKTRDDLEDDGQ